MNGNIFLWYKLIYHHDIHKKNLDFIELVKMSWKKVSSFIMWANVQQHHDGTIFFRSTKLKHELCDLKSISFGRLKSATNSRLCENF